MMSLPILFVSACGSGSSAPSSLNPQAPAFGLSSDQARQFCDSLAMLFGGYGEVVTCDGAAGGAAAGPTDQSSCVAQLMQAQSKFSSCKVTVSQVLSCFEWRIQTACNATAGTPPEACAVASSSQCSSP
jgi:hypothetical protein